MTGPTLTELEQRRREAFEQLGRDLAAVNVPMQDAMRAIQQALMGPGPLQTFRSMLESMNEAAAAVELERERERRRERRRGLARLVLSLSVIVAAVGVVLLLAASSASAHVLVRAHADLDDRTLQDRLERNLAHSRGAVRYFERRRRELGRPLAARARARLAWHRAALDWQREQLARVEGRRRPDVPPLPTFWLRLADCETGGDEYGRPPYRPVWDYNGSSGFDGGLQFMPSTWRSATRVHDSSGSTLARYPFAWMAPAGVQVDVAQSWLEATSLLQWPSCSRSTGLR